MDTIEPKNINSALLITDPENGDCTEITRRLKEKGIEFKMKGVFTKENGGSVDLSIKVRGRRSLSISAVKLPVLLISGLSKNDIEDIFILEGRAHITEALALRN